MTVKFSGLRKGKKRERSRKSQQSRTIQRQDWQGIGRKGRDGRRPEKGEERKGVNAGMRQKESAEERMVWSDPSLGRPRSPGGPGETERDLLWNLQGSIFHRCAGYRIPRPGKKNQIAIFLWYRAMGLDGRRKWQVSTSGLLCGPRAKAEWEEDRLSGWGEYMQKPANI